MNKIGLWIFGIFLGIAFLLSFFSKNLSKKWVSGGVNIVFEFIEKRAEWMANKLSNRAEKASEEMQKMADDMRENSNKEDKEN